jgi:ABC-type nickel/cobalt efflux system permease component RcnA
MANDILPSPDQPTMLEFVIALALGVKHSFDPDHLIAVSNILTKSRSVKESVGLSAHWTIGHVGGAILVTIALFVFRDPILSLIAGKLDIITAMMLIGFGLLSIKEGLCLHAHKHKHGREAHSHIHFHSQAETSHSHKHMLGIGFLQGLASNDELLLLLVAFIGLTSVIEMAAGVVVFSLGVFLGMLAFSAFFSLIANDVRRLELAKGFNIAIGLISTGYGAFMMLGQ